MAKLSVIIVNYNVKYFLEQCLQSVKQASKNITIEVIVVDNNSKDGSCAMLRKNFPEVQLIENKENTGFAVANNQGIKIAKGEYILLLNPDTLVQQNTFNSIVEFMDSHPDAGALGVKMLDGKGYFLPESKRALPTPSVSFYKILGLSRLFPKSKVFAKYHLGYLSEDEVHEVDVLAGAFMLLRKTALDKVGLLDETFFMYGEDVDLSYRLQQGGYKNYYFPETKIIHYKGESTKKGSLNYVRLFYKAMQIFAEKHFSSGQAKFYSFFINLAIALKASLSAVGRVVTQLALPVLDAVVLFAGLFLIIEFWASRVKHAPEYYPDEFMYYIIPGYILIWLVSVFLNGGYDKPVKTLRVIRGVVTGTILIAVFYAFLSEDLRFSRAIILLGAIWAVVTMLGIRWLIAYIFDKKFMERDLTYANRMVIVGDNDEGKRALGLINQSGWGSRFIGFVSQDNQASETGEVIGNLKEIEQLKALYKFNEVVFCNKTVAVEQCIEVMLQLGPMINYKFISERSESIVGSNSKNKAGDLYAIDLNMAIASNMNRRNKRLLDLMLSLLFLFTLPLLILFVKQKGSYITNIFSVLFGSKTWVGYFDTPEHGLHYNLPPLKPRVLPPITETGIDINDSTKAKLNLYYAKDYTPYIDLSVVYNGFKSLGE